MVDTVIRAVVSEVKRRFIVMLYVVSDAVLSVAERSKATLFLFMVLSCMIQQHCCCIYYWTEWSGDTLLMY